MVYFIGFCKILNEQSSKKEYSTWVQGCSDFWSCAKLFKDPEYNFFYFQNIVNSTMISFKFWNCIIYGIFNYSIFHVW